MGDAYPDAIIEGTDLSPIQPTDVPTNVRFVIDDAEQEDWAVPEYHYDYIHTRFMMGCFEDFRAIINRGFKHTRPGGWMESQDVMHPPFCDDGTMPEDWPFKDWSDSMEEASMKANRPLSIANQLKRWYIEAGFVDVHEKIIKLPINSWPRGKHLKTLGKYWAEDLLAGLQGFSLALFSREFGWSKTEIEVCVPNFLYPVSFRYPAGILTTGDQVYLVNVRKSITDHRVHAYHKYYVVYGRRPELSPEPSLGALTMTSYAAPTQSAIALAFEAHLDAINVPPCSPSPKSETSQDLSLDPPNHNRAYQRSVVSSSKVAADATEVSLDSLPLILPFQQEANPI